MSILQYPKFQYFIFADSANTNIGKFKSAIGLLGLFCLRVLHKNASAYSYQMRIVFSATEGGTALHTTDWFTFDNASTGQNASVWMGNLYFDVNQYRLNSAAYLHARVETTGYTPIASTVYLAYQCDWYEPIGNTDSAGARMTLGVYR